MLMAGLYLFHVSITFREATKVLIDGIADSKLEDNIRMSIEKNTMLRLRPLKSDGWAILFLYTPIP
jgi:hypothetical protein